MGSSFANGYRHRSSDPDAGLPTMHGLREYVEAGGLAIPLIGRLYSRPEG
jgi:hypothetical protein